MTQTNQTPVAALVAQLGGSFLSGKKTYLVGLVMIVNGAYALLFGEAPTFGNPTAGIAPDAALQMIAEGIGFMTVRAGISKSGPAST